MPEPCPSCPETRCSPRHYLPTVYRACRQLSPFNYLTVPPSLPLPAPCLRAQQGGGLGRWMSRTPVKQEWAAGGNVLSQTLGVAAPSTFSLHRIHLLTFRHQTILPCRDDHPHTHTHSHTHMHISPNSPLGEEIVATKPFAAHHVVMETGPTCTLG